MSATIDERCVFDTNVFVSALIFRNSIPARAFRRALDHDLILTSLPLLTELQSVLSRRKFEKYVTAEERE